MGEPARDDNRPDLRPVINAPQADQQLPVATDRINRSATDKPITWLVGVHGGAGATTLATILAPVKDAGGVIPAVDDPNTCVLVASSHKSGLRKLHDSVLQFAAGAGGTAELLGVIIVDHSPGKLPKTLAADIERITEATPSHNVWRVPYIPAWREARNTELPLWSPGDDSDATLTRKQRKAREDPLRFTPSALVEIGEEVFDRALALYQRLNQQ